jgi:hypothetical protein
LLTGCFQAKDGLTDKRFEIYTKMVEEECLSYIQEHFEDEGEMDFHQAMAQMIVFTVRDWYRTLA